MRDINNRDGDKRIEIVEFYRQSIDKSVTFHYDKPEDWPKLMKCVRFIDYPDKEAAE